MAYNDLYRTVKCRRVGKLRRLLEQFSINGYYLRTVTMTDLCTRYDLLFEKNFPDQPDRIYKHICVKSLKKQDRLTHDLLVQGWTIAFKFMSHGDTRYDTIFVRNRVF